MASREESAVFVQQFFEDEPDATDLDCAREGAACGLQLYSDLISEVRREHRKKMVREGRPKFTLVQPALVVPRKPHYVPQKSAEVLADIAARRAYYDTVLLENPSIKINAAMRKVQDKFGKGVDPMYAVSRIKLMREANDSTPKPVPIAPVQISKEPSMAAQEDKALTEYAIVYNRPAPELSPQVELANGQAELNTKIFILAGRGHPIEQLKIFKLAKASIEINVKVE